MDCHWIRTGVGSGGVARLTLCRPEKRNALNGEMIVAIREQLLRWHEEPSIRVLVIDAEGDVFCAGADIEWMHKASGFSFDENVKDASELGSLLSLLYHSPFPTMTLVQGPAYGGALGLVAASDMAVCTTTSTFCLSEVRLGLIPAMISPYLIEAIGQRQTIRHALSARIICATEACSMGLVHEIADRQDLARKGEEILDLLGKGSPHAQRETKAFLRKVSGKPVTDDLVCQTVETIATARTSPHGQEGTRAFLEKRKPDWVL